MRLEQFKALSFDCYGTLIDWESGMISALEPLTSQLPAKLARDDILRAHAIEESSQQAETPDMLYRDILARVYQRLANSWQITVSSDECLAYGQSVGDWPAFPDSVEALQYLKQHYKLIILSNVDNASFAASNDRLQVEFDAIYSAEDVGAYKPDDRNFEYMLNNIGTLGLKQTDLLHTAESMFHDHVPASRHGIAKCHIYRRHEKKGFGATMEPGDLPNIDFRFNSMAGLAEAHRRLISR